MAAYLACGYTEASAQETATRDTRREPLVIHRLSVPIELDGWSNEPAWEAISPLHMIQHLPRFGDAPTERTDVRLAYDDDYIYVAARLYESDPTGILPGGMQRDRRGLSNDWITLMLDTFNDKENALIFGTTPAGIRTDVTFANDTEGGFPPNESWNTFWDVKVVRNQEGWFAEFRIPFSSLRFEDKNGQVVMGVTVWRWIARKQEAVLYPAIPPRWRWAHYKPSQAQEVVFQGIYRRKPVYLSPYGLLGVQEGERWSAARGEYTDFRQPAREAGLDIKYGFTSNLTVDVTFNTDFAHVEADDQQVNLTRFSLFFAEKRLFFQERASAFDFNTGPPDRVFYSRRLGLVDGEPVRIYGGARLVGRAGNWEIGFADIQTAESEGRRSENLGIVRLRRYLLNPNTYVGGILTSRIDADGRYNAVYGLDGVLRVKGNDFLTVNWLQTFESDRPAESSGLDGSLARVQWERRALEGLLYDLDLSWVGQNYNPGLGFIRRTNYWRVGNRIAYGSRVEGASPVLRHTVGVDGSVHVRNEDGTVESAEVGPEWQVSMKAGTNITVGARLFYDDLERPFSLAPNIEVPVGSHTFSTLSAELRTPPGRARRFTVGAAGGSFYDGTRFSVRTSPTWDVSPHLELGADYEFNRVRFSSRSQALDAQIARLRTRVFLSPALSAFVFVQYNSAAHALVGNLRIRFNPREGNDLYIVWNEDVDTDGVQPVDGRVGNGRTLVIKYRHTLALEF